MYKKNKAFTLVELIVVITILAILATVAYISFQGYSQSARDSTRLANMRLIEKALSLYVTTNSFFPEPSNSVNMTFNNGSPVTLWKKGIVGESVHRTLRTLSEIPTDPITGEEYGYAVTLNKKEYELKAFMESSTALHTNNKVKAFDYIPRIRGNYNKLFLLGADSNYYSVPSLFGTGVDITNITSFEIDNSQVDYQVTQLLDQSSNPITPNSFSDPSKYEDFGRALLDAYTGSQLAGNSSYTELFTNSSSQDYTYFAKVALGEDAGETQNTNNTCSMVSESPSKSCNNNSWTLNSGANQCTNQLTSSLGDSCPSGYTNNGNSTCSQISSYSATAVCPSGYSNYNSTTCRRISTRSATTDCPSGYGYYNGGCYRNKSATVCPSGYSFSDVGCTNRSIALDGSGNCSNSSYPHRKPVHASPDRCYQSSGDYYLDPTCASGYVHVWGERCYDPSDSRSITYTCDSGYTYNGSNCERTQYASKTYSCNSGGTLNGTLCETTDTIASTPGSCPSGYILQADGITCLLNESEAAIITCNSGFTYNSSTDNCEKCE